MSSNDALSRMEELLDKLGIDYGWDRDVLYWDGSDGVPWTAERRVDGDLNLYSPHCTFKQAVAATLGTGTCEMNVRDTGNEAAYEHYEYIMHCEHCGHEFGYVQYNEDGDTWMDEKPSYCPACGRKVLGE